MSTLLFFIVVMHQSIPAVPIPPPGNPGAFAHVVSPGGGAFVILSRSRGWAFAYPGATPGHLTHVFSKVLWRNSSAKDEAFVEDWLVVHQGLHKLVDVFLKGMFSQF